MSHRRAYTYQRVSAGLRGIEWMFTLETWMAAWEKSGRLSERGRGRGRYVMARRGDVGPYSPANVEIILFEKNCADCRANHPVTPAQASLRLIGRGRGWTFVANGYQVACGGVGGYVGRFKTQREAEEAYATAVAARLAALLPEPLPRGVDRLRNGGST